MNKMSKFIKEYKKFIEKYIYNLVGNPFSNDYLSEVDKDNDDNHFKVIKNDKKLVFLIPNYKKVIEAKLCNNVSKDILSLVNKVCEQFARVSIFSYNPRKNYAFVTSTEQEQRYKYAVQLGICNWLSTNGSTFEKIFSILENWSLRTYEGRKVAYSIIVDISKEGLENNNNDFFEFLDDEFSATLTDSITSAFLVDLNGNLKQYLSIIDSNNPSIVNAYGLDKNVPLRFANLINKEVKEKRVGIFLLSNGDIIVSKKMEIILVKRNGNWLNCQYSSFENALCEFREKYKIQQSLLKELFYTILDISFSHTGGLISIQTNKKFLKGDDQIISEYDQIGIEMSLDELKKEIKKNNSVLTDNEITREANKRRIKKQILMKLLSDNNTDFVKVERKLRSELAALDGAFILNKNGKILAIGTIVQNEKGSSGGGRSSAAKRLSLNGIAIKISSDGYVEVFEQGKKIYSIK